MSEKRFNLAYEKGNEAIFEDLALPPYPRRMTNKEVERKLNEQQSIIRRDERSIRTMMSNMEKLEEENKELKERVYDFEKRKIIEESEIEEDVIPKIKLLRTELFGEKYE